MSTQHRDQIFLSTKLDRVAERSRRDTSTVFNNLGHVIDLDLLRLCFKSLDGKKATGIDRMTKEQYESDLENNLQALLLNIRRGSYHPKPSRICEIAKSDGGIRPLAIACIEDKIVQEVVRRIVENIYEPSFLDCSHGFRPKRGCDSALKALDRHFYSKKFGAVLEIDLKKYFNTIPHEPLIKMLRHRISDERFLHLIIKLLKAPTLDDQGIARRNDIGSPQGSILSPVLANIFLHYVLDLWFAQINRREFAGIGAMVRYADDAVFLLRTMEDAAKFQSLLEDRLRKFGIELNLDKTKAIVSGGKEAERLAKRGERMPTFSFLGFMHVWAKSFNKKDKVWFWRIKRRTCPERYRKKLLEISAFIKLHRHSKFLLERVRRIVQGYLAYFSVNDNLKRVTQFLKETKKLLFKWLNRRGGKRALTWEKFSAILTRIKFPKQPKIRQMFYSASSTGHKIS